MIYLIMKQPPEPKIQVTRKSIDECAEAKRVRGNLKALLKESESIDQLRPAVIDDNQVSHILNIIVQNIDRKITFGDSNQQQFRTNLVIHSTETFFMHNDII